MRPKKKIVIVGGDAVRMSLLKFMLETNGFAVSVANGAEDARGLLERRRFDLLLCSGAFAGIERLLGAAGVDRGMRRLAVVPLASDAQAESYSALADSVVRLAIGSAEMLEQVKWLTARKRGPRPAMPPVLVPAFVELEEAG